jgi:Uma2 family endonuclease
MSVVSIAEAWPATGRPFTVADLDRMPDDGRRYELIDGVLIVSPGPAIPHQEVVGELNYLLRQGRPSGFRVLPDPTMHASELTGLRPDLVVARYEDLKGARKLTRAPLLVVEVQSPSTALFDLNTKKAVYERFGIPSYWIVVPDPDAPELIVFELSGGRYEQVAYVSGEETFRGERPFTVEVVPARLVAGLFPD